MSTELFETLSPLVNRATDLFFMALKSCHVNVIYITRNVHWKMDLTSGTAREKKLLRS